MTEKSVADELDRVLGKASTKWWAVYGKLKTGKLPLNQVLAALQAIHDGRFGQPVGDGSVVAPVVRQRPRLIHGRYTPVTQQVRNLWRWNRKYGLGLPKGWDDQLDVPEFPEDDSLVSVNVVAFLEAKDGVLGEHRTFDAYWEIIRTQHPNASRWSEVQATPDRLRLLPGIVHVPGVRIEVIDHGANWDKEHGLKPMDVRSPEASPHAGLLASVAQHPKRIRKMDGTTVPFERIAGYQVSVPGHDPWRRVPNFRWYRVARQVHLAAHWDAYPSPNYSVPVLRRLPVGSGAR